MGTVTEAVPYAIPILELWCSVLRMRTSLGLVLTFLVLTVGCDGCGDADPAAPVAASETPSTETAPDEAPPEETVDTAAPTTAEAPTPPAKPAAPTPAELDQTREARTALRAGRVAGRAGDWAEAVTQFQASIAKNDSASARCELGWAHYQAGNLALAGPELRRGAAMLRRRAEVRENESNTLGACLYNLGRVAEESDPTAAAAYYRESLEVRPGNRVVQGRLDALDAPPPSSTCAPRACVGPARGPDDTVLATLVAQHYGRDTAETNQGVEGTSPFLFRGGVSGELGMEEGIFLAVPDDDAWYACFVMSDEGADYQYDEVHARQWIAGGRPELDFEVREAWHGREEGIANEMGSTVRGFVGWQDGRPVLYGAVEVLTFYYDGEWVDCDCDDDVVYSDYWDCCEDLNAIEEVASWSLASAGSGRIRVTRQQGTDGPATETLSIVDLACPPPAEPATPPAD